MTTRQEVISFCLTLPGATEDYPFGPEWSIMRHSGNRKMFAAITERFGQIWINVKADPMWGKVWKDAYSAVVPAFHMNKEHWLSIILDGTMVDTDIQRLILDSFDLTAPKRKKHHKKEHT